MSKEKIVVIADFGSSKINFLAVVPIGKGDFNILAKHEQEYSGYLNGKFLDEEELGRVLKSALNVISTKLNQKITKVFVGVPSEFCFLATGEYRVNFKLKTKISQKQLNYLLNHSSSSSISGKVLINKSPTGYKIDGVQTYHPIGMQARTLESSVCEILADEYFIDKVLAVVDNLKISVEFISTALASSYYLFKSKNIENAILVDCGFTSTSVTQSRNEGLCELKSFSIGGGHITGDLQAVLKLPYKIARELKEKLVLTITPSPLDKYELNMLENMVEISVKTANDIAIARIDMIASAITKCLETFKNKPNDNDIIYLTGGGLSYLKGISNLLATTLQRKVQIITPTSLLFNKPHLTSTISLLHASISSI